MGAKIVLLVLSLLGGAAGLAYLLLEAAPLSVSITAFILLLIELLSGIVTVLYRKTRAQVLVVVHHGWKMKAVANSCMLIVSVYVSTEARIIDVNIWLILICSITTIAYTYSLLWKIRTDFGVVNFLLRAVVLAAFQRYHFGWQFVLMLLVAGLLVCYYEHQVAAHTDAPTALHTSETESLNYVSIDIVDDILPDEILPDEVLPVPDEDANRLERISGMRQ